MSEARTPPAPGFYWTRYTHGGAWFVVEVCKHDDEGVPIYDTRTDHGRYGPDYWHEGYEHMPFVRIHPPL